MVYLSKSVPYAHLRKIAYLVLTINYNFKVNFAKWLSSSVRFGSLEWKSDDVS